MKKVTVVIPSFNGKMLLEKHLKTVLGCLRANDEVIIIDDASTDSTVTWLSNTYHLKEKKYPNLEGEARVFETELKVSKKTLSFKLIVNQLNLRFGAAVNRAVNLANGDLILLLNNDVEPEKNILEFLIPRFDDHDVFAVGCLEKEGKAIGGKNKLWFERGLFMHQRADDFSTGETAWVSGGSGLFDRKKWLALNGFDAAYYPAYWEDVDLSWRAKQKGWKVLFESRAIVHHLHETTNQSVFGQNKITAMSWKNGVTFTQKHSTLWQKILFWAWQPYWWLKVPAALPQPTWRWLVTTILFFALGLRLYKLGEVPGGMTWDEAAIGYNGWAMGHYLRDEWMDLLPISFRSFGDYKAPVAIYMMGVWLRLVEFFAGEVKITAGLIRAPFALSGMAGVLGMMFLTHEITQTQKTLKKTRHYFVLLTGWLMATLPWSLGFSRVGFESGLALSTLVWSFWGWWRWRRTETRWSWMFSVIATAATFYTYHSAKITVPILVIGWWLLWMKPLKKTLKSALASAATVAALLLPLAYDTLQGKGAARLGQTSIFQAGNSWVETISSWLQNWVAHLDPRFWILGATTTLRHGDGHWGVLLPTSFFLLLFGLGLGWKLSRKWYWTGVLWLLAGILPATIGQEVPHANRALLALPGVLILACAGIYALADVVKNTKWNKVWIGTHGEENLLVKSIVGTWILFECLVFMSFAHQYFTSYSSVSANDFNDQVIEAAQRTVELDQELKPSTIIFTSKYGQPQAYILSAWKITPLENQSGKMLKYQFTDEITEGTLAQTKTLIVADGEDPIPLEMADEVIYGADGSVRFKFYWSKSLP